MIKDVAFFFFYYAIVWSVPGAIMSAMVSLGDPQRIVFIDNQLSKNVDKLHANRMCMLSAYIGTRLFHYWVKYPFIRKRAKTNSIKFKVFMWVNALGMWSYILSFVLMVIGKYLT
ncbi:hypothetical protein BZG72_07325 [Salinivibrio sp. PR6]|uniref:hypothetical protein n=1 Tax=unclassified Salinivibrio TaxID=2636825 RepID=UPI00098650B8|nr:MULTISPECIES: hypothetical protein [unclassified Salinivibrio]OOE66837.1 hypothetical protein BZG20_08250 [Salinivibrio sp. IB868]OOE75709.1 hypothetical protein BZG22_05345 [Salinivibrio sp. IB870]OOE76560.1 hypothetical protein BZG25_15520 [Salinivibrio sp. ML198]OOE82807.1 hypothetical protein BZG72_07325 [Salinivibrio sp. PR6]